MNPTIRLQLLLATFAGWVSQEQARVGSENANDVELA
jgi:hypothetical protein